MPFYFLPQRFQKLTHDGFAIMAGLLISVCSGLAQAESFYSVEGLPVEKFDQTPAGRFAQAPWQRIGKVNSDIQLVLDSSAETPFIGNIVHGVGMLLTDRNHQAGYQVGMTCDLGNPPPGPMMLDFDFCLDEDQNELSPTVTLADAKASSWNIALNQQDHLQIQDADGQWISVIKIEKGQWYHVSLIADTTTGKARIGVAKFISRNQYYYYKLTFDPKYRGDVKYTQTAELILPKTMPMQKLTFTNLGSDAATGRWRLDNIVMAGDVESPRSASWPFDQPSTKQLRQSKKKAWAYYFPVYTNAWNAYDTGTGYLQRTYANPTSFVKADQPVPSIGGKFTYRALPRVTMLENLPSQEMNIKAMEQEIRLAKQIGLDGYVVDFWAYPHPKNGQATFEKRSLALLDAAQRVDPEFKIVPAFYSNSGINAINGESDAKAPADKYAASEDLLKVLAHPSVYRLDDGRIVLSMWLSERHSANWWTDVMALLEKKGFRIALFSHFNSTARIKDFAPISWGMAHWGPRTPSWNYSWVSTVKKYGQVAISPIASQDCRKSVLWEAANSEAFRSHWENAITTGADWTILNTWSDFSEQAQMPSTRIGYSFYDLNAYYITWFKTGKAPAIKRDALYYFYRRQHTDVQHKMGKGLKFMQQDKRTGSNAPKNEIELLAFLTQPGELIIHAGDQKYTKQAKAGLTSFKVPLPQKGEFVPSFELKRTGKTILKGKGQYLITDQVIYTDLLYQGGRIISE